MQARAPQSCKSVGAWSRLQIEAGSIPVPSPGPEAEASLECHAEILRRHRRKRNRMLRRAAARQLCHVRKFAPSSLASRFFPATPMPRRPVASIQSGSLVTKVIARIVCGVCKLVLDPRRLSPAPESAASSSSRRSPSLSIAKSGEPALALIFGCSDSIGTSLAVGDKPPPTRPHRTSGARSALRRVRIAHADVLKRPRDSTADAQACP